MLLDAKTSQSNSGCLLVGPLVWISFSIPRRLAPTPLIPNPARCPVAISYRRRVCRVRVDPLGMAEADITSVVPCGSVQFRPV